MSAASSTAVRRRLGRSVQYVLLAVVALIPLFPLYWLLISAMKTPAEFSQIPPTWFPSMPALEPTITALTAVPFVQSMLNSIIIAGGATISVLVTSILAGYVFAKHQFRGRDALFWGIIATMFLPPIVTIVPLYYLVSSMGLSDTYLGVLLPWLANAFGIFLMRQFIQDIPDELIEAARMDGAGEFRIVWQFVVPLLKPAIVTLAVFMFVYAWNNFLWPLSILKSEALYPVVLTLNRLMSYTMSFEYQNVVLAGAVIASLPTLLVFLVTQRVFVAGIAASGVKG
ncbi:carbohydrate ABC transporter permease [Microbacterium murale]|uniref:Multiple sugar transport system permease protein n=1 Tax=Microbacterium murale TaxID=1081040 RepID=A0ABU0PBS4_9MICO|nr:carbohydrate ABC transporter permease [Microbacterium murale]MDQ0644792.1 multiple sugar transport system permease protein [Microbacterium murale]